MTLKLIRIHITNTFFSMALIIYSFRGCLAQRDPFITKPQTKYVYAGHNVTLNCGVWNDDFTVQWRTPRGLVADNIQGVYSTYRSYYDLHVPSANHFLLVLLRATWNDAGRYHCSTFDDTGSVAYAYADIAVLTSPTCNEGGDYGDATENDRLSLSCSMNYYGSWVPVQSWTNSRGAALRTDKVWWRPSNVIRHSYSKRIERSDNDTHWIVTTSFQPKQLGNGGTYPHYNSMATPNFRHVYTSTLIVVHFSVRNIQLENVRYSLSPGNTITCSAEGFPVPNFRWSDAANKTQSTSATLMILASMQGRNTFTCEATNVVKNNTYKVKTSTTFYVTVTVNPIQPPQPPPFVPITEPPQIPHLSPEPETPSPPPIPSTPTPPPPPTPTPQPMTTLSTTVIITRDMMDVKDSAQSPPTNATTTAAATATTIPIATTITTATRRRRMTTSSISHPQQRHGNNSFTTQTSIENAKEINVGAIVGGATGAMVFLLLVIVILIAVICYMHIRRRGKEKHEEPYSEILPPNFFPLRTQNTVEANTHLNRTSTISSLAQERYEKLQENLQNDRSYDALQTRRAVNGYLTLIRDSHNDSNGENEQLDSVETHNT